MKKLIFSTLLLTFFISFGQEVDYTVVKNDPNQIKKLGINIIPFYFDTWSNMQTSMGYGISSDLILNDRFNFWGHYLRSYLQSEDFNKPNGNKLNCSNFELTGEFSFTTTYKNKDAKVNLSTNRVNSTTEKSTYINVEAKRKRQLKGRFGYNYMVVPYNIGEVATGEILDTSGSAGTLSLLNNRLTTSNIFAGISFSFHTNFEVKVKGYGEKSNGMYNNVYLDFITAPSISTPDIVYNDRLFEISDGNNGVEFKQIGWRLGYDFSWNKSNLIDLSARIETGSRTGFKESGFYVMGHFGATIRLINQKN